MIYTQRIDSVSRLPEGSAAPNRFRFPAGRFRLLPIRKCEIEHAESQKIVNFERIFPETTLRKPPARFRNGHEDNRIVGIIRHRAAKKRGLRPDE